MYFRIYSKTKTVESGLFVFQAVRVALFFTEPKSSRSECLITLHLSLQNENMCMFQLARGGRFFTCVCGFNASCNVRAPNSCMSYRECVVMLRQASVILCRQWRADRRTAGIVSEAVFWIEHAGSEGSPAMWWECGGVSKQALPDARDNIWFGRKTRNFYKQVRKLRSILIIGDGIFRENMVASDLRWTSVSILNCNGIIKITKFKKQNFRSSAIPLRGVWK